MISSNKLKDNLLSLFYTIYKIYNNITADT